MKRKIMAILLAVALCAMGAAVAACGGDADADRDGDEARDTAAIDTGEESAAEKVETGTVETITIKGKQYSTSLTELDLQKSELTDADIEPLRHMTNLTKLWLNENQISDIGPLPGLTNLTVLSLHENQISDVRPLSRLANLTKLYLRDLSSRKL
jgi:Leucine-rich repeat (LRR) protein